MKAGTITHRAIEAIFISILSVFLTLTPQMSVGQETDYPEPTGKYSREELAQMVAPIALYPDAILSQVLMASTYPIEIIEADRWVKKNPGMKDDALDEALQAKNWDPSVKAMCHFPAILSLMSERIAETTNLGNAFLAQEEEVMDMVQELRAKAYAQGNLATNSQQKVTVEKETIIIEPADPRVVYVPYYDPFYIYGPWWYPAYPPYYWGPPGVTIGIGISYWPAYYFGFAFGSWSYFSWHSHYIYIDVRKRPRYVRYDRWYSKPGHWEHSARHRRGVAYRDKPTAMRYGQYPYRSREMRHETRGYPQRVDRNRHIDDRKRITPQASRTDRAQVERNKEGRQRVNISPQERQRVERSQQRQPGREPTEQKRQSTWLKKQPRQTTSEPVRQERQRVERYQQRQPGREPTEQKRQSTWLEKQPRQTTNAPVRQERQRVERYQQQRSFENAFNRVENGRTELRSSSRGWTSRHGGRGDSGRWMRPGAGNQRGSDGRARNRR